MTLLNAHIPFLRQCEQKERVDLILKACWLLWVTFTVRSNIGNFLKLGNVTLFLSPGRGRRPSNFTFSDTSEPRGNITNPEKVTKKSRTKSQWPVLMDCAWYPVWGWNGGVVILMSLREKINQRNFGSYAIANNSCVEYWLILSMIKCEAKLSQFHLISLEAIKKKRFLFLFLSFNEGLKWKG